LPEIALDHSKHGIPNLERQISQSPALFMQAVAWTYKRSDGGEDPHEWQIDDPEKRSDIAAATYRLLDKISRIPGTDAGDGTINVEALSKWLAEVRQLCAQHGRGKVGDHAIGQLLSKAPLGQDGVWPCEPVCEALEKMASTDVADGFRMGVINARQARAASTGAAKGVTRSGSSRPGTEIGHRSSDQNILLSEASGGAIDAPLNACGRRSCRGSHVRILWPAPAPQWRSGSG
jgi:hypothetical protein